MKKWFKKRKGFVYILLFFIGLFSSYHFLEQKKIVLKNKEIVNFVLNNSFENKNIIQKIEKISISKNKMFSLLQEDYQDISTSVEKDYREPLIYLYNSHPTEEYQSSTFGEYSLNPTVIISNYILEDIFNKNGYLTLVEERLVSDVLEENNWNYASSYKASRMFLEDSITKYPSLKYFIDIHRDSLTRDLTTITIDNRDYAQVLFIIGLENVNYEENLVFTEKIDDKLNEYYPGLSKGIYQKEGPGVNGVYNQDFSPNTILIEIGGYENTTTEVLNTAIAFSKCMMEVIHEESN